MTIAQYANQKGLTREEYIRLKKRITSEAQDILNYIKNTYTSDTSMYNVREIFPTIRPETFLVVNELKQNGVQFFDKNMRTC